MCDGIGDDDAIPLPAPAALVERCLSRAWDDDVDDLARELLEQAGLTLRQLMARCVTVAQANERREAAAWRRA
jgi:hypothetical protein